MNNIHFIVQIIFFKIYMTPHFLCIFIISNLFKTAILLVFPDKICEGNNYFENVQYQVNTYKRTMNI